MRASSSRNSGTASRIAGEWKAPAIGSLMVLRCRPRAAAAAASSVRGRAREDELAGGVVVGDRELELPRQHLRLGLVAEDREHPAGGRALRGALHDPPSFGGQPQSRRGVNGAGRGQRRQLAERVAGHRDRLGAAGSLPGGDRRRVHGGLGEGRSVLEPLEGVAAAGLGRDLQQVGPALATSSRISGSGFPGRGRAGRRPWPPTPQGEGRRARGLGDRALSVHAYR